MKKIFLLIIAALFTLGACTDSRGGMEEIIDDPSKNGTPAKEETSIPPEEPPNKEQPPQTEVSFDLPEGWQWLDENHTDAIRGEKPPFHTEGAFTMLKFSGMTEGTQDEMRAKAKETFQTLEDNCERNAECPMPAEYQETEMAGGKLYIAKMPTVTFYPEGTYGWITYLYYVRDGKQFFFELYEDPDMMKQDLETIITTLQY